MLLAAALAVLTAACTGGGNTAEPGDPEGPIAGADDVEEIDCEFDTPAGYNVECGVLTVPEDWSNPDGPSIGIHYAVFGNPDADGSDDPVLYLTGGPGGFVLETVPLVFPTVIEPVMGNRDLVLLDQRGTGFSEPSLTCPEYTDMVYDTLEGELDPAEIREMSSTAVVECRDRLADEGADLSAYNTTNNATDLKALRQALEYEQWNIYGISYGSRLAMVTMDQDPEGIRSVVLDSTYPLDADLYTEMPANYKRALDTLFDSCVNDPACAEAYSGVEDTFYSLVESFEEEAPPYVITNPMTQQTFDARLTGADLAGLMFSSMYATEIIPYLPEFIAGAGEGRYDPLGLLQGIFLVDIDYMSMGMQLSVQCQEEVAHTDAAAVAAAADEVPELRAMFQGAPTSGEHLFELCEIWDAGSSDLGELGETSIPTLVLAGEFDPITPPHWGERVSDSLDNSYFFTFPSTGHGALPSHGCAAGMTLDFLNDPSAAPGSECIADIEPPAFTASDIAPEMRPYSHAASGISTVVPETWTEVQPGIFQQSLLVSVGIIPVPGVTPAQLIGQLASQLGQSGPLPPTGTRSTGAFEWQ
ncbi:MAG: alpha/beta fold hydrolase, partial [Dehalococcoidia bacterium]